MDQIIDCLNVLSYRTRNALSVLDISLAETETLMENIVLLRRLLTRWKNAEKSSGQSNPLSESIDDLIMRFFELEGMAKEQRDRLRER